ncbi:hypothetical protein ISF_07712 [Cordyceps fumosorosea ARSEF 2679]|uniref:Uncharacterized protein n=1 Tax=Cordyceps fumosorosea (strain ARSEF 2679) TaxID=1081104 RepID=A0A167NZI1_CORFA|nr:hypothetical protein ISF_07712 [Cordyceps fumosorosea ARSEF 2679]OAA56114.1 hypothetical protein ISF_07712 [Cordyceps fumosorosea ARSEF 2679]
MFFYLTVIARLQAPFSELGGDGGEDKVGVSVGRDTDRRAFKSVELDDVTISKRIHRKGVAVVLAVDPFCKSGLVSWLTSAAHAAVPSHALAKGPKHARQRYQSM